jgi:hypothetical protein
MYRASVLQPVQRHQSDLLDHVGIVDTATGLSDERRESDFDRNPRRWPHATMLHTSES